ncbi:MAG: GIY-YIG nuclease family protein [Patescibacteria group bacterium]|nr:GIY-YIG nuclease family protein [Patescibacteria group bacterium]
MKKFYVYILASRRNGTLYIGVTSNLLKRIDEHKSDFVGGFSKKYHTHLLVYYEGHKTVEEAILRERRLKKWERKWKLRLIETDNPEWDDLYEKII